MIKTFQGIFIAVLAVAFFLYIAIDGPINPIYTGMHFCIIVLSLLHIATARSFNLGLSFSFFALFFFGIIPLFEYALNITYHGANIPRDSSYLTAASLALLSSIFFYIGYGLKKGMRWSTEALTRVHYINRRHYQFVCAATVVGIIALAVYIASYHEFDFKSVFFRSFGEEIESTAIGYSFVNFFVRPLLFNLAFLVILTRVKRLSISDATIYALCILLVIFVSPLGIPRTLAGALYLPLLALVFFPRLNSKYGMLCAITFSILFAAPIADIFRLIQLHDTINLLVNFNLDYFFAGHFDAFHNLAQVVEYDFSSKGRQVLGALLFWAPRSLWPDKPSGTSFEFAEFAGFRSSNVSFSLTADLFVDFGIIGVILGMLVLGMVYKQLDNFFSKTQKPGSLSTYIFAIGRLELAILGIYLLRGNFLSSFAFTVGVASTLVAIVLANSVLRTLAGVRIRARPVDVPPIPSKPG